MTQDEIIEMAKQGHASTRDAIRWAMAQEREACANVCKQQSLLQLDERVMRGIDACTDAIRAMGQAND